MEKFVETPITANELRSLAKSLTELAIQNNLVHKYSENEESAKQLALFYKTIYENLK